MLKKVVLVIFCIVILIVSFSGCSSSEEPATIERYKVHCDVLGIYDIPFEIQDDNILVTTKEELNNATIIKDVRYPDDPNVLYTLGEVDNYNEEYFETHSILLHIFYTKYRGTTTIDFECEGDTLYLNESYTGCSTPSYYVNRYRIAFIEVDKHDVENVKKIEIGKSEGVVWC